jgi:ribokinase
MVAGGKGANQANAAARLWTGPGVVRLAGRVGNDPFAAHLRASLGASGVDTAAVVATGEAPTGIAMIWLDAAGQKVEVRVGYRAGTLWACPESRKRLPVQDPVERSW